MSRETLKNIFQKVFRADFRTNSVNFVWHAGEPLAAGVDFYRDAFSICRESAKGSSRRYRHFFQTNATLLNSEWIDLIRSENVGIGVSVDGPQFLHDQSRVTRTGRGTHSEVMRGIALLHESSIPFTNIAVLTENSLKYPDELFEFYLNNRILDNAFNFDEVEGVNTVSSVFGSSAINSYKSFLSRVLELNFLSEGKLRIREIADVFRSLNAGQDSHFVDGTNQPFFVYTIDWTGGVSTFSPELIGTPSIEFSNFVFGNINEIEFSDILQNDAFNRVNELIAAGTNICRTTCPYWRFCGGGAPANRYFETGRLDVSETNACRFGKQASVDVVLDFLRARGRVSATACPNAQGPSFD